MTEVKQAPIHPMIRRFWQQATMAWPQDPRLRGLYYWIYAVFFCGFLFFPSSKVHNNFFYGLLLLPSLAILIHLFAAFRRNHVFAAILIYMVYLVLANFWGVNVTSANVAEQIKHLLYVLAFVTASIVVDAYYPEKHNQLLVAMAGVATIVFWVNMLWWYQTHTFPAVRLSDVMGRMDNPILAGCIAGVACLVLIEILLGHGDVRFRVVAGSAFTINLGFIILSQSRTAVAALIPSLLVLGMSHLRRNYRLLIVAGFLAALSVFLLQDALVGALHRNSYRIDIWVATIEKTRSNLWWGSGYFCDTVALQIDGKDMQHAHNVYLATLRDGGIIGLTLLMVAVSASTWRAWRQARETGRYLTLALLTYGLTAVFFDNDRLIDNPEELWIFFWYPIGRVIAHDLTQADRLSLAQQ
jgi:O-antigen ligase